MRRLPAIRGTRGEPPSARTAVEGTRRLPLQATSFIGREAEVRTARQMLLDSGMRLLTFVGPPGVGKTRLALVLADSVSREFDDGAVFVDLSPIRDPELVPITIARAVGLREFIGRSAREALAEFLRDWHTLIVLDNFEQVVDSAGSVATVLQACPSVKVLATSREPLHIDWERQFPVAPLPRPPLDAFLNPAELKRSPAVALFVDRAREVKPDFELTDANARAVAEICVRLDGLPLAIEMAAARVKFLAPEAIAEGLRGGFALLASHVRNLPERHRTLRSCIAWSYELLGPEEQKLFRRLAVFRGGCTPEAAQAVCGEGGSTGFSDLTAALVDKSLLQAEPQPDGAPRLWMLESVREFAREELEAYNEANLVQSQHARYFLEFAERAEPQIRGRDQQGWVPRLEIERDNFRAAIQWSIEGGDLAVAANIGWALHWFWFLYGHNREGRDWLARVLSRPASLPGLPRAKALAAAGFLSWSVGEYGDAEIWLDEAVALLRSTDDRHSLARALHHLGHVLLVQRDAVAALAALDESITIFQELNDDWGAAWSLNCSGYPLATMRDYDLAITRMEAAHAEYRRLGDRMVLGKALGDLGAVLRAKGDLVRARAAFEESVAILRGARASVRLMWSVEGLAEIALRQEEYDRALRLWKETLILARELGARQDVAHSLAGLGVVAWSLRQSERAVRLLGAADSLRREIGLASGSASEAYVGRSVEQIRAALGDEAFDARWRAGQASLVEDLVEEALSTEVERPAARRRGAGPLSPREQEVAALIAQGLSNREIGNSLFIGHRTVATHVESILNKLGVDSRAQIAAWAASHGLTVPAS